MADTVIIIIGMIVAMEITPAGWSDIAAGQAREARETMARRNGCLGCLL